MLKRLPRVVNNALSSQQKLPVTCIRCSHSTSLANAHLPYGKKMDTEQEPPVPVTASPKKDQRVEHDGKIFTTVQEGKAYILVPPNARTSVDPQAKSKAGEHVLYIVFHHTKPTD